MAFKIADYSTIHGLRNAALLGTVAEKVFYVEHFGG
jgi:hypothetical protein